MSDDEFTFEDAMSLPGNPIERAAKKPVLQLSGKDGNAFFILGRAMEILRKNGYTKEQIAQYEKEATSGDYDHLLQTQFKWFDVR